MAQFKIASDYAVTKLVPLLEFKNYNGQFYLKIEDKLVHFNPSNKTKYEDENEKISHHLTGFFKNLLNDLKKEENNVYSENKEVIERYISNSEKCNGRYTINNFDVYEKKHYDSEMSIKFMSEILKKLFKYVKMNVKNTAFNDSNETINLPVDLTNLIYGFVPNDTTMDIVHNTKKNIMLPKNEIIVELIKFFPHIESNPKMIEIYYKYIDLYITCNLVINILRDKFRTEFHEKKSFPDLHPILKDDLKIVKNYIYLNKTVYSNIDDLPSFITNSIEQLFYSEIKQIRDIKVFENYDYFQIKFNNRESFHNFSEIEIFHKIFNYGYDYKFYKKDYKIPELLSNTTNILTKQDIYIIKQFPVWIKCMLENMSIRINDMLTHFSKLEKYDKSKSMVERVEKLIKLQNKYQYHILQKNKNQCRNELKKIEKFLK
jgi:hypothetical protein